MLSFLSACLYYCTIAKKVKIKLHVMMDEIKLTYSSIICHSNLVFALLHFMLLLVGGLLIVAQLVPSLPCCTDQVFVTTIVLKF